MTAYSLFNSPNRKHHDQLLPRSVPFKCQKTCICLPLGSQLNRVYLAACDQLVFHSDWILWLHRDDLHLLSTFVLYSSASLNRREDEPGSVCGLGEESAADSPRQLEQD